MKKTAVTKDGVTVERASDKYKGHIFYDADGTGYKCLGYNPKLDDCVYRNLKTNVEVVGCMEGFYFNNPVKSLSEKTKDAIKKHGREKCIEAFNRYDNGNGGGAKTIAYDMDVTTNQADAMIDAGRELSQSKSKVSKRDKELAEFVNVSYKKGATVKGSVTYYVAWSSWFDSHKYDIEKITKALKSIGATDIHLENEEGSSNQPEVVVFNFKGDGTDYEPTKAVQKALNTDWIIIRVKDWRIKKHEKGSTINGWKYTIGGL